MAEDASARSYVNTALIAEAWSNADLAMLVVDEDGHYIATNAGAEELTGYSREELTTLRAGHDLAGDEPSIASTRTSSGDARRTAAKSSAAKTGGSLPAAIGECARPCPE